MVSNAQHRTISIYMWTEMAVILEKAAKDQFMSVPDYFRERLFPLACQDAGVPVPALPSMQRRGIRRQAISQAASAMGLSEQEFAQKMAETVLAQLKHGSGIFPAAPTAERPGLVKARKGGHGK